jgi:hypothetical protein
MLFIVKIESKNKRKNISRRTKKKRRHTKRNIGKKTNTDLLRNEENTEKNTEKI